MRAHHASQITTSLWTKSSQSVNLSKLFRVYVYTIHSASELRLYVCLLVLGISKL